MKPRSIVWIAPAGAELAPVLARLTGLGFDARQCLAGESRAHAAELRVLQADAFDGPDALHTEYLLDARPTLVLTSSEQQELAVLPFLSEYDELAAITDNADLLALKLARLRQRAAHAHRAAPLLSDAVTGLPKRERFESELEQALKSLQADQAMALLYLDLDHFEHVNEQHTRLGGDLVLVQLSMLLGNELASGDKLAHLGADKFVCLLSRYDQATLSTDATLLVQRIAQHQFLVDGDPIDGSAPAHLSLTASAGLTFLSPGVAAPELWRQLDVALFDAKTKGRNRLSVYAEPSGIRPVGSSPEVQAEVQHFLNVTQVVAERVDQLLKSPGSDPGEIVSRELYEDPLTQLNNRRYFDLRLEREFSSAIKHGRMLSIAWINISHLHELNRRYGWIAGDKALKTFAEQAQSSIRLVDWLARCSGQEFCLVMPDTDMAEARRVADRVRARVEACAVATPDGRTLSVKISLGLAQLDDQMQRADELVAKAAAALYQSSSESIPV
jgi:two-component system cell cycle response regulator